MKKQTLSPRGANQLWRFGAKLARCLSIPVATFLAVACVVPRAGAQQTLVLTPKWSLAPGSRYYLPTAGGNPRGVALNRASGNILVPSLLGGSNHVSVVSGADGSDLGTLSTGGSGSGVLVLGTLALIHVGVADDGVIYACNLDNASSNFKIYRWSAEDLTGNIQPTVAFGGASGAIPGTNNTRIGDSFGLRGAGVNTQIIASGTGSGFFTIFTTTDGTNFTATQFPIPSAVGSGGLRRTVVFDGLNNAFYGGTENSTTLRYVSFDLPTVSSSLVSNLTLSIPIGMCSVRATNTTTIIAGIQDTGGSTHQLVVYDKNDLTGPAAGGNVAFPSGGTADGNITGETDIGNGMVIGLNTQNGLVALTVQLEATVPPSITAQPVGGISYPPANLTVGAAGTAPLRYQWQASNNNSSGVTTFTNIPGATTNFISIASASTNYYQVVITNAAGAVTSAPVQLSLLTPTLSTVVTQLWRVPNGASGYPFLVSDDATRGIGYDTNSHRLVVATRTGGIGLYILDANNGTNIGKMDTSTMTVGGTFSLDQVVIADDGAVYTGNLDTGGQTFILNRWDAPTTTSLAALAYQAEPGGGTGDRWGDTLAVRGAGSSTEILLGSRGGTNVALLSTTDGLNFNAVVLAVSNVAPGFAANGVAFGSGNTFFAKSSGGDLWVVAYDPVAGFGSVLYDYQRSSQIPSSMVGVGVDPVRNILAGIVLNDNPNDLQLFQLTGTSDAPVLFHQGFFASANPNGNANAAIAMSYPRVYGLDVNNGIMALSYGVPPTTPPVITSPPASQTVYTNDPAVVLSVGVSGSLPLHYQWRMNGATITGATSRNYTLNYPPVSASGNYDVIVRNLAGSVTSAPPAVLSVIAPAASTVVTQLWTLAPGSRAYLDGSSYNTRGLAYDPSTTNILVADHNNIYVLSATDGSDQFQLNTLGLPNSGYFLVDQLGVADDGALYACNLSLDGTGFAITRWDAVSASPSLSAAYSGDPGNGSGDRWGDNLAVRGSGLNTEVLLSSQGTNVALLTTTDGSTFNSTLIGVGNVPSGFASKGIAFGAGNTFWTVGGGPYDLRQVSFNASIVPPTTTVLQDFITPTQVPGGMIGVDADSAAGVLGTICELDSPNDLRLYLLSGNANPPGLVHQAFFSANNPNGQENGVVRLKAGHAFALDVNNGIVALSYGVPALPAFPLTLVSYQPGTGATLSWPAFSGHTYQVFYKAALTDSSWTAIGSPIVASSATASYVDASATSARYYRVLGN